MNSTYTRKAENLMRDTESHDQRIHRLAREGRNRGLQILEYPAGNLTFCTSRSQPDRLHRVTLVSCDCLGFLHTGGCVHHALLLHHMNALPALPGTECRIVPFDRRRDAGAPTAA